MAAGYSRAAFSVFQSSTVKFTGKNMHLRKLLLSRGEYRAGIWTQKRFATSRNLRPAHSEQATFPVAYMFPTLVPEGNSSRDSNIEHRVSIREAIAIDPLCRTHPTV